MEMPRKGNGDSTDIFGRHLKTKGGDMYSYLSDDMLIYPFGQATIKSKGSLDNKISIQ